VKRIAYLEDLLANPRRILVLIKEEVAELKSKYGDPRRTTIVEQGMLEFTEEDLIPHERVVVTLSSRGFIKRVTSRNYTPQHRGGKGIIGQVTREADAVMLLTVADTHDDMFFFTNRGKVFYLKCHEIPAGSSRTSKGLAVINLLSITEGERVTSMLATTGFMPDTYMVMATRKGEIKKTSLDKFTAVRSSGLISMDLEEGDELVAVCLAEDKDDVILVTQKGQSIRFGVSSLRPASRTSGGVRAMRLAKGDSVVSLDKVDVDAYLLIVTAGGYGKLTPLSEYPQQHRAGSGVRTFRIVPRTGDVTAAKVVALSEQLMIISASGMVTCTPVKEKDPRQGITTQGRSTQGVRVMSLDEGDQLVAVTSFE
jgi:DNA gyrase subunit A